MALQTKNQPTFPKAAQRAKGKSIAISKNVHFDWYEVQQYLDSLLDMINVNGKSNSKSGHPVSI